jgi:ADP-heptose:LPS heptosyltransferase
VIRRIYRKIVWNINAVRHRDPLSPRAFTRLFGSIRRRPWDPNRMPRRVVVLRSDEIGDTVTTLALLGSLRAAWPQATIHLVVKPGPATIFHALTSADRVFDWPPIIYGSALKRQLLTVLQAVRRFRLRGYDLAILPRWDFDDTPVRYLAVATRARSIVGFAPVPDREPVWLGDQEQLLTDVIARGTQPLLSVQQLRRVCERVGVPWIEHRTPAVGRELFDVADEGYARAVASIPGNVDVAVGIGIGARDAKRQWPVEHVAEALDAFSERRSVGVRILGGDVDRARGAQLAALLHERGISCVDATGLLSLSQSAAAIAAGDVFLGNDSGLQHIASSLDVPTVVVTCHPATGSPWSDNAPERFGPWSYRSILLQPDVPSPDCVDECGASEAHCIRAVSSGEVAEALERMMADHVS